MKKRDVSLGGLPPDFRRRYRRLKSELSSARTPYEKMRILRDMKIMREWGRKYLGT